jgi:hypothetical protein
VIPKLPSASGHPNSTHGPFSMLQIKPIMDPCVSSRAEIEGLFVDKEANCIFRMLRALIGRENDKREFI